MKLYTSLDWSWRFKFRRQVDATYISFGRWLLRTNDKEPK